MPRVKNAPAKKRARKRLLKATKGYWGGRRNLFKKASETYVRAMAYAFRDRKRKKREMRSLWIIRIGAAAKQRGMNYSTFINGLIKSNITVDRKILAETAVNDPVMFDELVETAKQHHARKTD